ncbi:MAG: hypothetical protein OXC05_09610 [Halieaceae bacterium]|nr:hypothetical protein [Halieaceae bacterium]
MRRRFIAVMAVLLIAVAGMTLIKVDPGYVLVSYGLFTLESSLWVALLILMVVALLIYFLVRLLRGVLLSGGSIFRWWGNRRIEQARKLTLQGVLSYLRGDWSKARRSLLQAVEVSPEPAVNYLLAARASVHLNEIEKAEECYLELEAAGADPQALALSRARESLHARRYSQAATALESLTEPPKGNVLWLTTLKDAYVGAERWAALAELLPQLKKCAVLDAGAHRELALRVQRNLLLEAGRKGVPALESAWSACPDELRREGEIAACYAAQLLANQAHADAEKLLQKSLKKDWHPQLVRLYGLTPGRDANRQLQLAESWLQDYPEDAEFLLCLGRLALRNKLWGKARSYFETSHRLKPSSETCAELARLLFSLGEREISAQYYREGLLLREQGLPELPLPKQIPEVES